MGLKKALTAPMQGRMLSPTQKREVFNIYWFLPIPVMAMKTKEALLLLPHSGFPWDGAKKGTNRIYARLDALIHPKKRGFHFDK
ncbi:hypothetical protein COL20_24580 [Bacillus sp. AFS075034]|nr:hypothetical protein COL20_24580 [Bacillus sp. AFS075034]